MAEFITWEQLTFMPCYDDQERIAFQALITAIDQHFPPNWRTWKVNNYSFKDLFGKRISQNIESKIRFALPIVDLARIFQPSLDSVSEIKFRHIKKRLLDWPLGRSILYAPHDITKKIHGPDYRKFINAVRELKPKLTNRALPLLRELAPSRHSSERPTDLLINQRKRHRLETPVNQEHSSRKRLSTPTKTLNEKLLIALLKRQTAFHNLLTAMSEQNEIMKKLLSCENRYRANPKQDVLDTSSEAMPDSTCADI